MGRKVAAREPSQCALVSIEEREGRREVALAPGGPGDRALALALGHWGPGAHFPWALDGEPGAPWGRLTLLGTSVFPPIKGNTQAIKHLISWDERRQGRERIVLEGKGRGAGNLGGCSGKRAVSGVFWASSWDGGKGK